MNEEMNEEKRADAETEQAESSNENEAETTEANASEASETKEQKEQEDYKSKYFYLAAEMQNMQKRFEKEKEQLRKFGSERILNDLVDVIDNFERTLSFVRGDQDEKVKNIVVGIEMINKQLLESLERHGLKQVKAMGEIFDPNLHEALAQQEDETKQHMEIINVQQEGYELNGRLLRPAKVIVAKNEK